MTFTRFHAKFAGLAVVFRSKVFGDRLSWCMAKSALDFLIAPNFDTAPMPPLV